MEAARGNSTGYGIGWEQTNSVANQCTGNKIHHNLVYDNEDFGINLKFIDPSNYVYNNTLSGNGTSLAVTPVGATANMSGIVKNNISMNPTLHHWNLGSSTGNFNELLLSDNLYYPDGAAKFYSVKFGSPYTTNFSCFKTHVAAFGGTESDTLILDPLLTASYRLNVGSPAIDVGIDWGQTRDKLGTVKVGAAWDIGAYEYFTGGFATVGAGPHSMTIGGGGSIITIAP
jgi:hypothetical protein